MSPGQKQDRIVIANCGGFWGDDPTAAARQVQGGPIDYLVMDYLAEVTMAILQKQRAKRPETGFATDFLRQMRDVLVPCAEKGVTIISNAGGVNPLACAAAMGKLADELGVGDKIKVGVVLGDDIYADLDALLASGEVLAHMETGRPLTDVRDAVLSANVYLGAQPVAKALDMGANVVISGRVTDTGVTLAPMLHAFGWADDDWDRLAAGVVAGHIIECGTQCTGGNFTDWRSVPSFERMGYPLIEAHADGTFVVTKHPGTGGLVNVHTVSEQLLYEMGAPTYLSPDCIARFDSIQLRPDGENRVAVSGIVGEPAPAKFKVSVSFAQGYRAFGRLMVAGPDARAKAKVVSDALWASVGGRDNFEDALTQYIGWDSCHPSITGGEPGEILIQFAVRDRDRQKIDQVFAPQIVPRVLATVPGITYLADQGRPRASDVVGYWPALMSRECLYVRVVVDDQEVAIDSALPAGGQGTALTPTKSDVRAPSDGPQVQVTLQQLCLGRSGDKGDTANIGVLARSPEVFAWMQQHLTAAFVKQRFGDICKGEVERFEVPNLGALNFLLHGSLGGGGTLSLLMDAQGKTYAQYLLATTVEVSQALLDTVAPVATAAAAS